MEAIPGEAKPATPCASSRVWPEPAFPEQLPAKRAPRHTGRREARQRPSVLVAPSPCSAMGRELMAMYSSVREPARGGWWRERDKKQVSETQQIFIFTQERKMKPPVSEHHHFHLPFNQPLPASPSARPSQVQAVILFLSQKGARGLACRIRQFIKQIKSLV